MHHCVVQRKEKALTSSEIASVQLSCRHKVLYMIAYSPKGLKKWSNLPSSKTSNRSVILWWGPESDQSNGYRCLARLSRFMIQGLIPRRAWRQILTYVVISDHSPIICLWYSKMSGLIVLSIPLLVVYVLWDRLNSILRITSEQINMYLPIINKVCM